MTIDVYCPKCGEVAFTYYIGYQLDLRKNSIYLPKPLACVRCSTVIGKITRHNSKIKKRK